MNDPFKNIRKIVEQQNRSIQKMFEPTRKLLDSTLQFARMNDTIARMREINSRIPIRIREQVVRTNKIRESIDSFNKNLPEYLISIASYGWYIDFKTELDLSIKLAHNIRNKEVEKVDDYLSEYYTNNFDAIIEKLSANHPERFKLFKEIKIAFYNEYYYLEIPLILSQVDGICYDYTKKLFFTKNKKDEENPYLPNISNELYNFNNEFLKAFLAPFYNNNPIFSHERFLESFPSSFNRHRVLHGIDTDYGTKTNCLKTISLLSYCEDVLMHIKRNTQL